MANDACLVPEMSFIGSILKNPSQIAHLVDVIQPEHFHNRAYGMAWRAVIGLHEKSMSIDSVTVGDELDRGGLLSDFGASGKSGRVALSYLRTEGDRNGAESYAKTILDYSNKRTQEGIFIKAVDWARNGRTAEAINLDVMKSLSELPIHAGDTDRHTLTIKQAVSMVWDETDAASRSEYRGVPSGFIDLDKIFARGFHYPDLTIWAARPGRGKTAILLDLLLHAAQAGKRVVMFSLEMSNSQVTMRLISKLTGISFEAQQTGTMSETEWPVYASAIETLGALKIHLNDMPAIKNSSIRSTLRKIIADCGPVDLVLVDYIQLQDADIKTDNRVQEVSSVSRGLKATCKMFNIPIHAAAQLSRAVEQRAGQRPILSDLRESGSLEQDADNIIFLHPKEEGNEVEIIIAKHRNGQVGSVMLIFRSAVAKFENATTKTFAPNSVFMGQE